jgi:hypothetical protein
MDYYYRDGCAFNGIESGAFFSGRSKRTVDDRSRGFCSKQQQPWSGPGRPSSVHVSRKNADFPDSVDRRSSSRRSRDDQKRDKLHGSDRKHKHTTAKHSRNYSRRHRKNSKDYDRTLVDHLPDISHIHRLQAKVADDRKERFSVSQNVYSKSLEVKHGSGGIKRLYKETNREEEEDESLSDGELSSSSAEQPGRSSHDGSSIQYSSYMKKPDAGVCDYFCSEDDQPRKVHQSSRNSVIGSPESSIVTKSGSSSSQRISYARSLAAELRKISKSRNNHAVSKQRTNSNGSLNSSCSVDVDGKSTVNDGYDAEFEGSTRKKHSSTSEVTPGASEVTPETFSSACVSSFTFTGTLCTSREKDQSVSDKSGSRTPVICSPDVGVPSTTNMSFTSSAAAFLPAMSSIQNSCNSSPSDR